MKPIQYGRQEITEEDIRAVVAVMNSDRLTQGPKIDDFEKAFSEYIGAEYAVAVSNGTAALHLSALALDIKKGDKVITSPVTFVASANCVRYAGGEVTFADIDPESWLIDLEKVEDILRKDKKVRGIIPVDFAGRAVDMPSMRFLADKYNVWILEDACHAPGGYFEDTGGKRSYCGNSKLSELSIFSFHPVKHITCGEGGMITTSSPKLNKRLRLLRTHGISRDEMVYPPPADWYYEMQELGFNYRLTDIQATLGLSQLKRAPEGIERRREIAAKYFSAFDTKPYIKGQSGVVKGHAYHLYVIETEDRNALYNHLKERNIHTQVHYIPVHLMPYYRNQGWKEGDFPFAEKYYSGCLSLPMYPSLTDSQQEFVINTILEFFQYA